MIDLKTHWWDFRLTRKCIARVNAPMHQFQRMKATCFRRHRQCAGNFRHFLSPVNVLADEMVINRFPIALRHALQDQAPYLLKRYQPDEPSHRKTIRLMIDCPKPIGWESTVPLTSINDPLALEVYQPNRRSWGLRIRPDRIDIRAPLTHTITFVIRVGRYLQTRKLSARIETMYPGVDIGNLSGDILERTGRVFISFDHPGQ